MALALLFLLFLTIVAVQAPGLVRAQMWGELAAFGLLLVVGMAYALGAVLDIKLPNPTVVTQAVFGPAAKVIETLLQ